MTVEMDATFAAALREALVSEVESANRPRRSFLRTSRWIARAGALLAVLVGGGGIAYATGAFSGVPGGDVTTPLAAPVTVTGVGRQTVGLGKPPAGTTDVTIAFTCLAAGTFDFDGASGICNSGGAGQPATISVPLAVDQDSITISATPRARWRLTATYSKVTTTAWGINASGQTYGVASQHGIPDLVAVVATNHRSGYVYANQLYPPPPKSPAQAVAEDSAPATTATVYESDGKTPVGRFVTREAAASTLPPPHSGAMTRPATPLITEPATRAPTNGSPAAGPHG